MGGAAWIDKCRPDLLISESTYATTIRDSKRCRERDFLKKVHDCVEKGGKVLIPVFALGRAQELGILLETYWERMNLKVPVFFSMGLTEKANNYYKMFISWTNEKIRNTFVERNMFDFRHIKSFDRSYIDNPGPMVVFATPGMLHAGLSLNIFKRWCSDENNMIIMPGYCVAGTVGHKILNGTKTLDRPGKAGKLEVKMSVQYMSFSAHADAKGIMQLISYCEPKNVMLVHGEGHKMEFLKHKIRQEHGIECYMPANGETAVIPTPVKIPASVSTQLLKEEASRYDLKPPDPKRPRLLQGVLIMKDDSLKLYGPEEAAKELGLATHSLRFTSTVGIKDKSPIDVTRQYILKTVENALEGTGMMDHKVLMDENGEISVKSVLIRLSENSDGFEDVKDASVSWSYQDENLGSMLLSMIQ